MKIYHTCASEPDVRRAENESPSMTHGVAAIPRRLSHADGRPWFLDNGAYRAWNAGEEWDSARFVTALERAAQAERLPEFVVVPDVPGDATATAERAREWASRIDDHGLTPYAAIQPGHVERQLEDVPDVCEGVLVGGAGGANARRDWRRMPREDGRPYIQHIGEQAAERGLSVHVGRPGRNLGWWREQPIDSVDTASIVRNGYWSRLRRLEAADDPKQMVINA